MDLLSDAFDAHLSALEGTRKTLASRIVEAGNMMIAAFRSGGKVLLFGNGGSAADAIHIEGELLGRFRMDREGLPAIALGGGLSALTAIANDYDHDAVFPRLVRAHLRPEDLVVLLSTSGDSPGIIEAAKASAQIGAHTIGLTGASGGGLRSHVDLLLNVPSTDTPRIQEIHILIGHILCDMVEQAIFG